MPLKGDDSWADHSVFLDNVVSGYTSLLACIRNELLEYTGEVAQMILRASMDITYTPKCLHGADSLYKLEQTLARYKAQKHHGVVTILHISKLRYPTYQSDDNVREMILDRNAFIDCMGEVLQKHNLELRDDDGTTNLIDLTKTQLFMPPALFQVPGIVKAIKDDGRSDCLGRPVGHMFHDNKVDERFRFAAYEDGNDILGRSRLHIACSLTADQQVVSDLKEFPGSRWLTPNKMLDLGPLDVAAIHGNLEVLTVVLDIDTGVQLREILLEEDRTCYHWAACFGHLAVIEHLLKLFNTHTGCLDDFLTSVDTNGDTPLYLAARNGHLDVVKSLSQVTNWEKMDELFPYDTPFWSATSGRHLEIMKFLEPFSDVNQGEVYEGKTPLAEAAQEGFFEGIRFLVQLDRVSLNSVSTHWKARREYLLMTPLDLAISGKHENCSYLLRQRGALTYSELKQSEEQQA